MRLVEQFRQFHAQAGKFVNIEKTPVICDVIGGNAEVGCASVLILNQGIQLAPGFEPPGA